MVRLFRNIAKVDPCRAGWLRDETNGLKLFWYECRQLSTLLKGKRKLQANGKEISLAEQNKAIDERS